MALLSTREIQSLARCGIWVNIAGQDYLAGHTHDRWQVSKHDGRECPGCGKLMPKPLLQEFRRGAPTRRYWTCKDCGAEWTSEAPEIAGQDIEINP
jgi:hypothetical protein